MEETDKKLQSKGCVCVTGATGFVAGHIIELLLSKGYKVHGTVRSKDEKKIAHLIEIQKKTGGELVLFESDLMDDCSFAKPIRGCDAVIHCASPYVVNVVDPEKELVKPAVFGTLNVLRSCVHTLSVKRVIVTSSVAAITDSPKGVLTEDIWNTKSSINRNPYFYSKVQAEQAAWNFVKKVKPQFEMVVINPYLVMGPSHTPILGESPKILADLIKGIYPVIMSLSFGLVDVRDVAKAHVLALEKPNASGRYVCFDNAKSMTQLVDFIKADFPQHSEKLPKTCLSNSLGTATLKFFANFQASGVKDFLQTHLGQTVQWDSSKIKNDLGIEFMDIEDTLRDTINDLEKYGHIPSKTTKSRI
eukprot:TRINITY_DN6916_c0_g1_i3.p1 TRINITY_DN6916_c0_g1~~TRINITY_DN6916_c0_g1_i3.p1  ORF type:complete len:360 (-),score=33.25 TRINITY_DN6916_c0_g1_i3:103-1182(-)